MARRKRTRRHHYAHGAKFARMSARQQAALRKAWKAAGRKGRRRAKHRRSR
jgi:TRAP-type C4-dicarboxylate transport system substrate-binding protein